MRLELGLRVALGLGFYRSGLKPGGGLRAMF